jgi:predicted anti-sigma-YlaC factor YlaD
MSERTTMNCEDALRLLADYLDGELAGEHRHDVDEHLARCRSCFSRAEFERRLKTRLATLQARPVHPGFEHRIHDLLHQFALADRPPSGAEQP